MRYGRADDGNVIEAVMWIAPAALGSESFGDFAHEEQLRQARKISMIPPSGLRSGYDINGLWQHPGVPMRYKSEGLPCAAG